MGRLRIQLREDVYHGHNLQTNGTTDQLILHRLGRHWDPNFLKKEYFEKLCQHPLPGLCREMYQLAIEEMYQLRLVILHRKSATWSIARDIGKGYVSFQSSQEQERSFISNLTESVFWSSRSLCPSRHDRPLKQGLLSREVTYHLCSCFILPARASTRETWREDRREFTTFLRGLQDLELEKSCPCSPRIFTP